MGTGVEEKSGVGSGRSEEKVGDGVAFCIQGWSVASSVAGTADSDGSEMEREVGVDWLD